MQHDTRIHVAQLLQEHIGAVRHSHITLDQLVIDDTVQAQGVVVNTRLTHIPAGVLAKGQVEATILLECSRCVEEFAQPLRAEFADQYRAIVDIVTGAAVPDSAPDDEDQEFFAISDLHLLDLHESIRQALALELPMAPLCREDCPGLPEVAALSSEEDTRLAILRQLLVADSADQEEDQRR